MTDLHLADIEGIIRAALAEFSGTIPAEVVAGNLSSIVLFGDGGVLDSVELVSLLVTVEEAVSERSGRIISLTDERAMSQRRSPFRTAATLSDFLEQQLKESVS